MEMSAADVKKARERAEQQAIQLMQTGYSPKQIVERSGVPMERLRELAATLSRRKAAPQLAGGTALLRAGDLFVDESYQRPRNLRRVLDMVKVYDSELLGVLEVSQRPDGTNAIIDGAHRWELVKSVDPAGEDALLLCRVHRGLSVEDEARMYYALDATRRPHGTWDRWKARRRCGDPIVHTIEAIAAAAGLRVEAKAGPGVLSTSRECERLLTVGGEELLQRTIDVMVSAFGADSAFEYDTVAGVGLLLSTHGEQLVDAELIMAMSALTTNQLRARGRALREIHGGATGRCVAQVLVDLVNANRHHTDRLAGLHGAKAPQAKAA